MLSTHQPTNADFSWQSAEKEVGAKCQLVASTSAVCTFSSRTASKGTGQLQQFLKNATSLIQQPADHGSATCTKGKYAVQSGNLTRRLLQHINLVFHCQPSR